MHAPYSRRYVGLFHWSTYWHCWDRVLDVRSDTYPSGCWVVQQVDEAGEPIGPVREHVTDMDAGLFADRPFDVRRGRLG